MFKSRSYITAAICLVFAFAGSIFCSSQALAQEESAQEEFEGVLEEVIVTASKRDQRLVDVPMAVTALVGEQLVERNLLQIEEFAEQVPGLHVESIGNRATRIVLRGLNSGGAGATVATLIDEAALSYSSSISNGGIDIANLETYDLNRIEVLRGPQGTLYGAAAEGGIIKYVTNAPKLDQFEGDAETGLESIEQGDTGFTGRGMLNMPFANGKAAFRVSGFYRDLPGYIDNPLIGRKNANDGERYGGRIQLLAEPSDNFSIRLMALMQDQSFNDPGSVELIGAAFTPGTRNPKEFNVANGGDLQWNTILPGFSDNETRLYSAVLEWSTKSVNILSATSFGEINSTFGYDMSFNELAPGFTILEGFAGLFGGPPVGFTSRQTNDLEKFNQEIRFSSPETLDAGSVGWDWQVGVFYSEEDITFDQFFDAIDPVTGEVRLTDVLVPAGFPPLPLGGQYLPSTYEEISGFGEVVLHFNEKFDLALGGRYSSNEQWAQASSEAGLIFAPFDILYPAVESDETKFTWSFAPSYHLAEDRLLYGRIATGYRPGGPVLPIPGAPDDFPLSFDPDSTVNYEIGIKGATDNRQFTYDFAAYYIDWTDIQIITRFISETSGQSFSVIGNAGTAVSKGVEWNLAWEPLDGFVISDNGAYIDAKLTESAPGLGGVDGDQLPFVPEWTNALNVDYTTDVGNTFVTMGATWAYTGDRYTGFGSSTDPAQERQPGSHVKLPSYSSFSARVVLNFDRFRVRFYGTNLTDERGLTGYGTGGGFNHTGFGRIIQPRTFGVMVGASF